VSESGNAHLFASAQCLGYGFEHGYVTEQLCFPSQKTIIQQLKRAVEKMKVKMVFVATDNDAMLSVIQKAFKKEVKTSLISISLNMNCLENLGVVGLMYGKNDT
jgi:hypothetical protein